MNLFSFVPGYTTYIYQTGRQPALVMLLTFLLTFIVTRAYTRIARVRGWGSASIGGVHTHHLVFGLVLGFSAGAIGFAFLPAKSSNLTLLLAAIFGAGAALVLDEFALLFHLQDVYWEQEGRKSIDAVIIATIFGFLFLLRSTPLGSSPNVAGSAFTIVQLINLIFVIITALKGKVLLAVFGVFVPLLAIIGSIRLAEPSSLWARNFYKRRTHKLLLAKNRYQKYHAKWGPRKERLLDILGGKPGRPNPVQN